MTPMFRSPLSRSQLLWTCVAAAWAFGLLLAWPGRLIGDEWIHFLQIQSFRSGESGSGASDWLTMLPGYHWLVAWLMGCLGFDTAFGARAINAGFALATIALFYLARRELHPADAGRASAQLALLPILFPFFFLTYTDVLSLGLILAAWVATLKGRHRWSAVAVLAAMLVRQNNVVWAVFFAAWSAWPAWIAFRQGSAQRTALRQIWPYAIPLVAFLAFWAWNGTMAYSGSVATVHPDVSLHVGTPLFALFLIALLLPLQAASGLARFLGHIRQHAWRVLLPVLVFAMFAAFFVVDHPYNRLALSVNVRNQWLMLVQNTAWAWWIFGLSATAAAVSIREHGLVRREGWALLPVALVFLSASWLIEPRYTLIPLTLYLSLRVPGSDVIERITSALWAIAAVYLAVGIFDSRLII